MPNETPAADPETCPCCAGFGHVEGLVAVIDDEHGRVEVLEDEECPRCDGTGEVERSHRALSGGSRGGVVSAAQTIGLAECVECGGECSELSKRGRCPACHSYAESLARRTTPLPASLRVSPEVRAWLDARVRETGLPVDQILDEALLAHIATLAVRS